MATTVNDRALSGNDIAVYLSPQTTKGTINTNPAFNKFRRTEGKAKQEIAYVQSGEVKSNRQGRAQVQDTRTFTGEPAFELNQAMAAYLDAAIHGTQANNDVAASTTIGATATGFTSTGNKFANISVGDWFKMSGFANAALNVWYKVKTKADNNNVTTWAAPAATESAGASVSIESRKTKSGKDQTYYTVQTRTLDKSATADDTDYRTFYDAVINTLSLSVGESGIVTGSMALNIESLLAGDAKVSGQTDSSADTSDPVSVINNLAPIYVDGVNSQCKVKTIDIEINNNYSGDRAAGCQGEQYAFGDMDVTGSVSTRAIISNTFEWRDKFEASTPVSIALRFYWADGKWMIIDIMRAKLTEHNMPDGSNVISQNDMSYGAEEDPETGATIQIFRSF